jgi:hypothetical protein
MGPRNFEVGPLAFKGPEHDPEDRPLPLHHPPQPFDLARVRVTAGFPA